MMELIIVTEAIIIVSMVLWFINYKREEKLRQERNKIWDDENYRKQVHRLNAIKNRCNKYLNQFPPRLQTPNSQILVTHEDLILIWDGANHVQDHL